MQLYSAPIYQPSWQLTYSFSTHSWRCFCCFCKDGMSCWFLWESSFHLRPQKQSRPFVEGPFAAMVFKPWRAVCQLKSRIFPKTSVHPPFWGSILQRWTSQYVLKWMVTACDKNQTTNKKNGAPYQISILWVQEAAICEKTVCSLDCIGIL